MKLPYSYEAFMLLDYDDQLFMIQSLYPEEYFSFQHQMDYYINEESKIPGGELIVPAEIEKREEKEFRKLFFELVRQKFEQNITILFDLGLESKGSSEEDIFKDAIKIGDDYLFVNSKLLNNKKK